MLQYYLLLAISSVRRTTALSALIITAVAIGVGGTMSLYTIYHVMSADPIPAKSSRLFTPQIDNWGPHSPRRDGQPPHQLTYRDARALLQASMAQRQAAMFRTRLPVQPADAPGAPFSAKVRATYGDFFPLFDVPFASGSRWPAADDADRANVAVISARLSARLFGTSGAVDRTLLLNGRSFRVVGVLAAWNPSPRFYDLGDNTLADSEDIYIPFTSAVDQQIRPEGMSCFKAVGPDWQDLLGSECVWIQFWLEMPTADATPYRNYLRQYASDQKSSGRFDWLPTTRVWDVKDWLTYNRVVPDEVRVTAILGYGFLLVCLLNAIGLLLAKFASRFGELGIRRALGATRRDVFLQCLVETAVIGAIGGLFGWLVTVIGVAWERTLVPEELAKITHVDGALAILTLVVAVVSTVCVGVYPAWRASRLQPALQLKAQ